MSEPAIDFGQMIYERRISLGLTQKEAAEKAKVSRWSIERFENGHRTPSELTARKICLALEIDPSRIRIQPRRFEIAIHTPTLVTKFPLDLSKESK